jgi:chromosome segregation ATPase
MSDNPTREIPDSRSFEERVFARFDALDGRIERLDTKVDALDGRLTRLEGRLTTLEEKVDSRLQETRPIWEGVLTRLDSVEHRLGGIEIEVKDIGRGVELLHRDFFKARRDQEELRERIEKLESPNTR